MQAYVDIDTALGRIRGNKKLYAKMLGMFLQSPEFDALEAALQANDYEKCGEAAHAIKGITGNLSLMALFETSTELMNQFRANGYQEETLAAYRDALEKTRPIVEDLIAQFNAEA